MPNLARVVFDHAKKLANMPGGTLGTALSAFDRGVQATAGQPGPEIKVEPFGPHSYSPGAEILKLGTSVFAAARARANWEDKQRASGLQENYLRAKTNQANAAAGNRYTYTTPQSGTQVQLTGSELATQENRAARHAGAGAGKVTIASGEPSVQDVVTHMRKSGYAIPATFTSEDINSYRNLYGLENPTQARADKKASLNFDPRTEAEIASETESKKIYDEAVKAAEAKLQSGGTLIDPRDGKSVYTPGDDDTTNPSTSPFVVNDPAVIAATNRLHLTRGRNVMMSLGRAKDFDSIIKGLTLLTPDDPLLDNPSVHKVAIAAVHSAFKLAKTPAQIQQLDTVVGLDKDGRTVSQNLGAQPAATPTTPGMQPVASPARATPGP